MLRITQLVSIVFTTFLLAMPNCQALDTPVLSLSTTQIFPEPGQVIDILASGSVPTTGVSLGLEIGDGDLIVDEPVFTSLDFSVGPYDDVGHDESNDGPVESQENLIEAFIASLSPTDEITPEGVIAQVTVDASGFSPGEQFPFRWSWSTNLPGASKTSFIVDDQEVVALLDDLLLTIIPVPEPATFGMAALGVSLLMSLTGRHKRGGNR